MVNLHFSLLPRWRGAAPVERALLAGDADTGVCLMQLEAGLDTTATIVMPSVHPMVAPIVHAIPVQLLAYHTAVFMGKDVDQPRNLAKSVTVE